MTPAIDTPTLDRGEKIIIASLAVFCFGVHMLTNITGAYGFFRDELYYLACADHLAWGYVDHPPFSIFLLKLSRLIFGDSLTAVRLVPSLAHTGTIVMTGLMVKQMGGKRMAILLAGVAVLCSLIHIGMCLIYSMNAIDIFLWSLTAYLLLKIINTRQNSYWIVLGFVLGIGLMNKISFLFLGAGLFVGLVFTDRQALTTRWPYYTGAIAGVLFLPYVIWNLTHDLAHLEFIHNANAGKYSGRTAMDFLREQFLLPNPISFPFWVSGLVAFFVFKPLKPYRILGWIYLTAFAILVANGTSKGEYLAPGYALLFAGAGVFIEQALKPSLNFVKYAYMVLVLAVATILLPVVLPVLPVEDYITYTKKLDIKPESAENKKMAELPQFYADMFGWEEKAADVAKVFHSLSPEDQKKCAIISTNYGRCGAIDFFGNKYGLPNSIGKHNNYWIWGPGEYNGEVLIILGGKLEDHVSDFASVEESGVSDCKYCMPYENHVRIFVCRGLKESVAAVWPEERNYE
jgi:hypothetical protein